MAQVFGEPGRNAAEQSFRQTKQVLGIAVCTIAAIAVIVGYMLGARFSYLRLPPGIVLGIGSVLLVAVCLVGKWAEDKIDSIDRERMAWRKGAAGEALVAGILATLPGEFVVVNDITKRFANIDHIVIGPTGVYVVDTKNWKGTVSANGSGELLLNGKSFEKPTIKATLRAVMDFQNKLKALVEKDYFVRGLIVFPMAYIEANFGSTGHIHCLRDDRVIDYIENQTFSAKLDSNDITRIKRATLQLAQMDEQFVMG
jgi:hypothetical protein